MKLILALIALVACWVRAKSQVTSNVTASTCVCTTVSCPVEGNNYLTEGGGAKGTYVYKLANGIAVVSKASVTITKADLDQGSDTTQCTQDYARSLDDDGTKDCDAGHILAHRLGGPGNQPINIFPQASSINRGIYAQFEDSIYDCVNQGVSGSLSWTFTYSTSTRTKPTQVTYSAKFSSGGTCTSLSQVFTNEG